jgi:hypothetical protein
MMRTVGTAVLLMASAGYAFGLVQEVPEIDGGSAVSVIALVAGGLTILRARRGRLK